MIIRPDILRHPKYRLFRQAVGPEALEYLCRLWAHCSEGKRGENWGKVSPQYVEMVCEWQNRPGQLWEALTGCSLPGKAPWVKVRRGCVVIHEWEEHNKSLLKSWFNGRLGGRPKSKVAGKDKEPTGNPRETHGKPTGNPHLPKTKPYKIREEKIREDKKKKRARADDDDGDGGGGTARFPEVAVPSLDEFLRIASLHGLPEAVAREEWLYRQSRGWDGIRDLAHHIAWRKARWEQQGRPVPGGASSAQSRMALESEKKAVLELLQSDPANPECAAFLHEAVSPGQVAAFRDRKKRLREINRLLAGGGAAA
jgi:hypothetical protein